jgi:hypothetical protein
MDCFVASAFARRRASADKSAPRNDVERWNARPSARRSVALVILLTLAAIDAVAQDLETPMDRLSHTRLGGSQFRAYDDWCG